jgi:hypothetical protein
VARRLAPDGRFFATCAAGEQAAIVAIADAAGARAELLDGWIGDGQKMLVIRTKT